MPKLTSWAIALAAVALACSKPSETPAASAPVATGATQQMRPASNSGQSATRMWAENCMNCHGAGGEGGGAGTRTLNTKEKFSQDLDKPFFDAIKNGVPDFAMPAYAETMTDAEIWSLVVHIRELQARALRRKFGSPQPVDGVFRSQRANFRVETVVEEGQGLRTPWAIDWLPDAKMLVTNRPGFMTVVDGGRILGQVQNMPPSVEQGQGGLMEVAVHPDYAKNGWVYLALSDPAQGGGRGCMTKIVRGKLRFQGSTVTWTDQQTIFELDQKFYNSSGVHFGSRIVFDGKGHIFFCIGERGSAELAQDLSRPNGKVYRVREDGTIPPDNPFVNRDGAIPAIWSYGHRNPQGLVQDLNGALWDTEHAPRGGDEVNRVVKGANYGWPVVSFGINYSDAPFKTPWPAPDQGITQPVFRWLPSTGACGLDVARGAAFPGWKGDLLAGGLVGNNLDRLRIVDDKVVEHEELIHGIGRIRDVSVHRDGTVYIALNGPDKIIRLVPAG